MLTGVPRGYGVVMQRCTTEGVSRPLYTLHALLVDDAHACRGHSGSGVVAIMIMSQQLDKSSCRLNMAPGHRSQPLTLPCCTNMAPERCRPVHHATPGLLNCCCGRL